MSSKMPKDFPDFDQVVVCLLAFCEEYPSTYELVDKLNEENSAQFKSAVSDVESARELYAAEEYVKQLKAKRAFATECRITAKQQFGTLMDEALAKITALSNA